MSNSGLILLVEDNADLNESNSRVLTRRGYEVQSALTLAEARLKLAEVEPDIILLDVELPDGNGMDFCEEIRDKTAAHILFLTSKIEHENMVLGLKFGGDDYITKPFHLDELLARIDAAMRRRMIDKKPVQTITKGTLTLDIATNHAFLNGENLSLTPTEFSLLVLFVQNKGKTLDTAYLYEEVRKQPMNGDSNAIRQHISRLKKKLESASNGEYTIFASRNEGYSLEFPS